MSYFDHVQCHSCGARMDPEKLVAGPGEMPHCPYCNQALNLADLFGVKDAFVGHDDNMGNDHSLDDLVGGELYDGRYVGGRAPEASPGPGPGAARGRPQRPPGGASPRRGNYSGQQTARKGLPGPTAANARNAMVPTNRPDADDPGSGSSGGTGGGAPSAADLLREMKRKK